MFVNSALVKKEKIKKITTACLFSAFVVHISNCMISSAKQDSTAQDLAFRITFLLSPLLLSRELPKKGKLNVLQT